MALTYGDLAQLNPGAASLTDIFTATGNCLVVITAANRGAATALRISIAVGGAADDPKQYKAYDRPISDNGVFESGPHFLANGDKIRVYATLATLTFTVNGLTGF